MARLGLLGGTFNPPHVGHLVCALEARHQLGLDRVDLLPVHSPPHKDAAGDVAAQARLEMCRLAVEGREGLGCCDLEVVREGRSYTVDTLEALEGEDELTFIVGGDMAWSLPTWREPERILSLARLGIAERENIRRADILEHLSEALPGSAERIDFFDMPRIDISSTAIRRRLAEGRPVDFLVPDAVADFARREGLYA